jgi:glycosyltransferase involved in cell wall biosynthesis
MVTRNRARLAERAVRCFCRQTWKNRELVVIDDGSEDYGPMLKRYVEEHRIRYVRRPENSELRLGDLRNLSLDEAAGEFLAQWDDDEWYHPSRLEVQMRGIQAGADAVVLRNTLCHLDTPAYSNSLFHTAMKRGQTPGTILHRKSPIRYPSLRRAEDSEYLAKLGSALRVSTLDEPHTHLFIRCFHGKNTWDIDHFQGALQHSLSHQLAFLVAKHLLRDLRRHPAFRLSELERQAAEQFFSDSRDLGVLLG